ncbi:MAG: PIG-L deacetylase family protein, partial [Candidatus Ranarchaeia archaeon]
MVLDVLVFNAHPDDEVMIGGTIGVLSLKGYSIAIIDMTDGEPTMRGSHETRRREAQEAA